MAAAVSRSVGEEGSVPTEFPKVDLLSAGLDMYP
jgi:hypothetical protein